MALSTIQKIDRLSVDCDLAHQVIHGAADATVPTEGGPIPTMANAVATLKAYNVRGDWVAGMTLAMKDVVVASGVAYVALSSAGFVSNDIATDLAAGRIGVHQGATVEDLANPDKGVRMIAHAVDDRDLASADAGKGVTMIAHAVDDRVLAADDGASMIGVRSSDPDAVRQTLIQVIEEHFTATRYGADPSGGSLSTDGIRKALAKVTQIAQNLGVTQVPAIELPAGIYRLDDTLALAPWHKLVSLGNVELNFEALDASKDGIVLRNDQTAILEGDAKGASMAPFLSGKGGTIFVKGPGKAAAQGWGVRVGDTVAASGNIRDTGGEHVIVTGWRGALRYDPINTYLLTWTKCRFEQNREEQLYVTSDTAVTNSGEKMTFRDCVFSAANHAVYHNCDGFMYEFDGCSFDYHAIPFKIDALGRYTRFLIMGGHSESFDDLWFDATVSGARVELALTGHEILPTKYVNNAYAASVRKIVEGNAANRMRLTGNDNSFRYTVRPYLPDTPLIGDNVLIHGLSGTIQEGNYGMPSRSRLQLRDGAFLVNAIGTSGTALTHWARDQGAITDVSTTDIQSIDALGQSLHLVGSSTNSTVTFHSVDTLAVKPGEVYGLGCDLYGAGTTGDLNVRVFLRFFDYTGAVVGADAGLSYKMADAFADAAVPNFSLGRTRAMCTDSGIQTVPPFATTARVYFTVSAFVGDVYIKNVRAFPA